MVGIILELAGFMLAGHMSKRAVGRASASLISAGLRGGKDQVAAAMTRLGTKSMPGEVGRLASKIHKANPRAVSFSRGPMTTSRMRATGMSRAMSRRAAVDILGEVRGARAWGSINTLAWAVPGMAIGGDLFSGAADLATRSLSPPEQLMQAEQYMMPRAAYTQRQRALQAIHSSQMTTRAAIGSEAQFLHR